MPRKATEILKSQGYTDDEIANMSTMLADVRFIKTLEGEDARREKLEQDLAATTKWYHEEAVPALNKALGDATNARGEAARVSARLKAAQEYGLARIAADEGDDGAAAKAVKEGQKPNTANTPFDDSKYVSNDTFLQTTDQFGNAIAMATDIQEDYRELYGHRMPGGVSKLRADYQSALKSHTFNGTLAEFADKQFGFSTKRQEQTVAARQKELDDARKDERMKVQSEMANPMTRLGSTSRNPFVQKIVANGSGTTTKNQPWERGNVEQVRAERVVKFAQKVIEKTA